MYIYFGKFKPLAERVSVFGKIRKMDCVKDAYLVNGSYDFVLCVEMDAPAYTFSFLLTKSGDISLVHVLEVQDAENM